LDFTTLPGCCAPYCTAWTKHGICLTANDNPYLLIYGHTSTARNALIQLIEHNAVASLGLLRTVANFHETLNDQMSFLKRTSIPYNVEMSLGSFVVQFQVQLL